MHQGGRPGGTAKCSAASILWSRLHTALQMPSSSVAAESACTAETGNEAAATADSHFTLFRVDTEEDEDSAGGSDADSWGMGRSGAVDTSEQGRSSGSIAAGNADGRGAAAGCELLSGTGLGEEVTQLLQHVLLTSAECAHSLEGLEEVAGSTVSTVDQLRQVWGLGKFARRGGSPQVPDLPRRDAHCQLSPACTALSHLMPQPASTHEPALRCPTSCRPCGLRPFPPPPSPPVSSHAGHGRAPGRHRAPAGCNHAPPGCQR